MLSLLIRFSVWWFTTTKTLTLIADLLTANVIRHRREKNSLTWWLDDGSGRFLSFGQGRVELVRAHRPDVADDELLGSVPLDSATVAAVKTMVGWEA